MSTPAFLELNYKSTGQGQPLVLLHGLFGSLENLGLLSRALAEQYQVYAVDLPNHGRSPHTERTSLPLMAQQVKDWMDAKGLNKAILVGHSLGGKVAMELALTYPESVVSLVVIDIAPVAYPPSHGDVFAGLSSLDPASLGSRSDADLLLLRYVPEPAVRSFLLKNLVRQDQQFAWRMNFAVLQRDYGAMLQANRVDAMFPGPVLFLKGENSSYIRAEHEADMRSRFPAAGVKIVADTGHWLHAEKPSLTQRLLIKFLQQKPS